MATPDTSSPPKPRPTVRLVRPEATPDVDDVGLRAAEAMQGGEDVGGLQTRDLVTSFASAVLRSKRVTREGLGLAAEIAKVGVGRSAIEPARGDWRFKDPAWRENPAYRRVGQGYLAAARALEGIIESEDLDWKTAERARMLVSILTAATAPTNTVAGNPAAVKRAFETGGKSLVRGARNFVHDVRHNGGMPAQVDTRPFRKGENVAATPGRRRLPRRRSRAAPVHAEHARGPRAAGADDPAADQQVLLHGPRATAQLRRVRRQPGDPVLHDQLAQPDRRPAHWTLDTYVQRACERVDVVSEITGSDDINVARALRRRDHDLADAQHLAATR